MPTTRTPRRGSAADSRNGCPARLPRGQMMSAAPAKPMTSPMSVRRSSACARRPRVASSAIHNAAEALRIAVWLEATCCMATLVAPLAITTLPSGHDEHVPPLGRVELEAAPERQRRQAEQDSRADEADAAEQERRQRVHADARHQVSRTPDEIDDGEADDELRAMRGVASWCQWDGSRPGQHAGCTVPLHQRRFAALADAVQPPADAPRNTARPNNSPTEPPSCSPRQRQHIGAARPDDGIADEDAHERFAGDQPGREQHALAIALLDSPPDRSTLAEAARARGS